MRMRGMHQTCRAGLQSRAPHQSSRSSCKQATRATPGHASFYGGGTAPAYSDHNPGGETPRYGGDNCPAHQEDHEEEEASNPEWPFDSHIWLSSHICNREFQVLGDLYSHQNEDHQDLFLPLSEGEEIDDRSTYALRIQGQVGCENDPYKHPAPTAIIAMISEVRIIVSCQTRSRMPGALLLLALLFF